MILFRPFLPYMAVAVLAILAGLTTWAVTITQQNKALKAELALTQSRHRGCTNRIQNIMEDKQSDASVTDPGTFNPPDSWFLPLTGANN